MLSRLYKAQSIEQKVYLHLQTIVHKHQFDSPIPVELADDEVTDQERTSVET